MIGKRDFMGMLLIVAVISTFLALLPTPRKASNSGSFLIKGVLLFDGKNFQRHMDVWVEAGRIRAVGRHSNLETLGGWMLPYHLIHTLDGSLAISSAAHLPAARKPDQLKSRSIM